MDVPRYFTSLSQELTALKHRVRHIIDDTHWATDGEWKESVLRSILRRHLPKNVDVGSGFLVTPQSNSKQIDVLIYDNTKPVLFRESDLVLTSCDAAKAIVEVKASIQSPSHLREVLNKLANQSEFIIENTPDTNFQSPNPFVGLFVYDWNAAENPEAVLDALREAALSRNGNPHTRIINHIALGDRWFFRYWQNSPLTNRVANYCSWHAYDMQDRAFGYFIHNIVDSISTHSVEMNPSLWFPAEGKEQRHVATRSLITSGVTNGID